MNCTAPEILPLTQIGMPCQYHNFKLSQYHNVDGQYAMSNTQGNAPSYSPLLLPVRPVPTFLLLANIGTASHTTYRYSIFIPDQRFHWSYLIPKIPMFLTITDQRLFFRISPWNCKHCTFSWMKTIEPKSTTWLWSNKTFAKWQKLRSNNRRSPKILPYYARLLSFPSLKTQHFCFSPRRWTKYVSMGLDAKNWLTHATALSAGSELKSCVLHEKIVVNSKLSNRWNPCWGTKNEFSVISQKKDKALFV